MKHYNTIGFILIIFALLIVLGVCFRRINKLFNENLELKFDLSYYVEKENKLRKQVEETKNSPLTRAEALDEAIKQLDKGE